MSILNTKFTRLCMLLSCSVFLNGCFKDDLPECLHLHYLTFEYTKNKQGTDLFPDQVKKLDIYAFDLNGKFIKHFSDQGAHLSASAYAIPVDLPAGNYTFVVWAGIQEDYHIFDTSGNNRQPLQPHISFFNDSRLALNITNTNKDFPENLYFGIAKEITLNPNEFKQTHIQLTKNTNTIRVSVNGLQNAGRFTDHRDLDIICNIANGELKFDNTISLSDRLFQYIPVERTETKDALLFRFKTLRLLDNIKSELILKNLSTGEDIFKHNLIELLLLSSEINNNEDLDINDEYDITISMHANAGITITINGFTVHESDWGLQ